MTKLRHLKSDELTQTNITLVLLEGKIKVDNNPTSHNHNHSCL